VNLSVASVTKLPAEWTAEFNFVNQRLLTAGLLANEWPVAVSEIFRVLRPGGSTQLAEYKRGTASGPGFEANERITKIREALYEKNGLMLECAQQLPKMLEAAGFVNIKVDEKVAPAGKACGEIGAMGVECLGGALRRMRGSALKAGGLGVKSEREYDELMDDVEKEWDERDGIQYECHVICAQKPL